MRKIVIIAVLVLVCLGCDNKSKRPMISLSDCEGIMRRERIWANYGVKYVPDDSLQRRIVAEEFELCNAAGDTVLVTIDSVFYLYKIDTIWGLLPK